MRTILSGIAIESAYPAVWLGAIASQDQVLLIDAPLRADDARDWLNQVSELGTPRFLAVLDHHPDRVLASRNLDLPRIAQAATSETVAHWPDTFKGAHQPLGSEVDRIKRLTGINKLAPDLTFDQSLLIHLGDQEIRFIYQPGPTQGAMWVVLEDRRVVFVGDAVTTSEPPFLGFAELDAWSAGLDVLRGTPFKDFKVISSRDGLVDRDAINNMARFLRKVPVRMDRLGRISGQEARAQSAAEDLLSDFKVSAGRRDMCRLRLQAGLLRLHRRDHPGEE